jgi:hypothetical protein
LDTLYADEVINGLVYSRVFSGLSASQCLAKVGTNEGSRTTLIKYAAYSQSGNCYAYSDYNLSSTRSHGDTPILAAGWWCSCAAGCGL